jgi:hypothetical protein
VEHGEQRPAVRVSDAERDRVALALRDHLVAGRLTLEELSERVDAAYTARTVSDLDAALADLPADAPTRPARRPVRWIVAVMSGAHRRGRIRIGERTTVVAVMGGAHIDLRGAELDAAEVELTCVALMGGIDIVVPEGLDVEVTGLALMGGNEVRTTSAPRPGAPVVRIRAYALMGGINVREKKRRAELEP